MNTLLLRLIAPMQSWGVQSHYTMRDTGREPSKSGVIGLLCAAMGRPRDYPLDDLTALRMGVRIDREGTLSRDYHIAQDVLDSSGKGTRDSIVTNRYYLANAAFLVGLEGDADLLQRIQQVLRNPVWALFLGRKAFPPSVPVWLHDGFQPGLSLEQALSQYGWIISPPVDHPDTGLRAVIETRDGNQAISDFPISFAERRFTSRRVRVTFIPAPTGVSQEVL